MSNFKHYFDDWSLKEKAWLAFVLIFQTIAWVFDNETTFMLIMTLTSSLNLVLGAKGKIEGLYFAIIWSVMYSIQCFTIPLYGEIMYNILYSIPISIASIILWKKNMTSEGEVKFRTMTKAGIIQMILITVIAVWGYAEFLEYLGGGFAFMDSLTTVVAVIASFLYMKRYSEQWLMWVVVNVLAVVMWIMIFISGDSSAFLIIIMNVINMINSVYGYFNWRKISVKIHTETP
ncbi:nicotinamide mononucleotide transporter [Lonepinella koalarum]|uniref:Nicotinamide riboside transporter PnuC n=1 Tax=Lonepinella koalarum TaxID=53417 RepID=A0A4R1L0B4_9PAST|nr:nicotinamide riboside transporter PnuC [Lonepinella koalarum]MDH2926164.1 nicotinamide mononucleotide transporter PnuC [Lonepinella koalarum]TCK71315.1 nicotinamide mononucleotide transporter [Lonepinella koalarum]TFJ91032.1 nicotinamide mononucleotide transporter PnuC [Lonepinella koalarum]TYG34850.1 nicotinamide mononucleotide transporter [Lonepinella koalarum]